MSVRSKGHARDNKKPGPVRRPHSAECTRNEPGFCLLCSNNPKSLGKSLISSCDDKPSAVVLSSVRAVTP